MISAQTLRVCREGKPLNNFPVHALGQDSEGKTIKLTRVTDSTLRKRYRSGLKTFWKFLIDNGYVSGPAPDFSSSSKKNPPPVERDAFHEDELLTFLSRRCLQGARA